MTFDSEEHRPGPSVDGDEGPVVARTGARVGRYLVLEELGRGGMGRVVRAYDPKLQREVALRELRRSQLGSDGAERLVAQARAMARLSHPNVVFAGDWKHLKDAPTNRRKAEKYLHRVVEITAAECKRGYAVQCKWHAHYYEQWDRQNNIGYASEIERKYRRAEGLLAEYCTAGGIQACDYLKGLYLTGEPGVPANPSASKKARERACKLVIDPRDGDDYCGRF